MRELPLYQDEETGRGEGLAPWQGEKLDKKLGWLIRAPPKLIFEQNLVCSYIFIKIEYFRVEFKDEDPANSLGFGGGDSPK